MISPRAPLIRDAESQLEAHDIALPLSEPSRMNDNQQSKRTLRLLLLSPNGMSDTSLPITLSRIQHFASLTGGIDVAIVMLLSASRPFASAKTLIDTSGSNETQGLSSYTRLQCELMTRTDLPWIHVLPLATLDGLVDLIKGHSQSISRPKPKPSSAVRPLDMLAHCSTEPPLSSLAINLTSDVVPSMGRLAQSALAYRSSLGLHTADEPGAQGLISSDDVPCSEGAADKIFDLLAEQLAEDVVDGMADFWQDDWIID